MELFHIISVLVPLGLFFLVPPVLARRGYKDSENRWVLGAACLLFFVSWYVPSPLVDGQDTSFTTHFLGGGVFSALIGLYLLKTLKLRLPWYGEVAGLFALVSALGVINELFEFVLVRTQVANILITDTSWDLVANTAGALLTYAAYRLGKWLHDRWH